MSLGMALPRNGTHADVGCGGESKSSNLLGYHDINICDCRSLRLASSRMMDKVAWNGVTSCRNFHKANEFWRFVAKCGRDQLPRL